MNDRDILRSYGYDPDDPVPRDDEGQRVMPYRLIRALAYAPFTKEGRTWRRRSEENPLTVAELTVLVCLSHGLTRKATATLLEKGLQSVMSQLKSATKVLGADSSTHACCEAIRRGLIP